MARQSKSLIMASSWLQRCFESIDNAVRHHNALGQQPWLRNLLRRPYHAFLRLNARGYSLHLGGAIQVQVPPEYASKLMEDYEKEEFAQIVAWGRAHPGGLVVDVGCSQGYMSCAALFSEPTLEVLAIDTDLNSLQTAGRLCRYASGSRLHRVQAMVAATSTTPLPWPAAKAQTEVALTDPRITGDPGTHRYLNLDAPEAAGIAKYRLDDLLVEELAGPRPLLVKCDVEGAEYEVLAGAEALMRQRKLPIVLSVHPGKLEKMGRSVQAVVDLLSSRGYGYHEFAVDHEHHWLCTPIDRT